MDKKLHISRTRHESGQMNTEERILWNADLFRVPQSLSKEEAYDKLLSKINEQETSRKSHVIDFRTGILRYAAAAAVLIALLGLGYLTINKPKDEIIAGKGYHSDYRLPDGSSITLNADTKITYNKEKFSKKRYLKMDGEAFFNIEKGIPFTIKTGLAEIQILGTSFNVFSREDHFKVSCFTGKILVRSGSQSVVILPMESTTLQNNKLVVTRESDINESARWRSGEFSFENTSLEFVFAEIERQFNVTFVSPEINDKFFTGSISNKNLVDALDIVCLPMGLTYEIGSNSKIFIRSKTD